MIEDAELDELRGRIDELDHQMLSLLRRRAEVVMQVGDLKREKKLHVYDPKREEKLLARLSGDANLPLDEQGVRGIFAEIVSHCRRLEEAHMLQSAEIKP